MKKRLVPAAIAALLLVTGVAAWLLLRPSDDGVITLQPYYPDKLVPVEDLTGDYDIFESISIAGVECSTIPAIQLYFEPKGDRLFTIGTARYVENSTVGGVSLYDANDAGVFYTYNGLGWSTNDGVYSRDRLPLGYNDNYEHIESRTLDENSDRINCVIALPAPKSSGRQRLELYFRERFTVGEYENGSPIYSSGEELYSVSFEFDIPEPNGEPYEVLHAVDATERGRGEPIIYALVRCNAEFDDNAAELQFIDEGGLTLEKLTDGEWAEMQPSEGAERVVRAERHSGNGYTRPFWFSLHFPPEELDYSATYRITVPLTEFPEGGGKTYNLQFSFRFPE